VSQLLWLVYELLTYFKFCGCLLAVIIAFFSTEFLDDAQMDASVKYSQLTGFEILPTLFLEFHGSDQSIKEQAELTGFT